MASPTTSNEGHGESHEARKIAGLDGVRGLAVILVLLFHGFSGVMHPLFAPDRYAWHGLAAYVLDITAPLSGGVEIFFVLSGFLITRSLLAVPALDRRAIRSFYRRRVARLLPLYLVLLAVLVLGGASFAFLILSVFFLSNWAPALAIKSDWIPIWSIAVEFQFYLLWPLLLRLCGRRGLMWLCAFLIIASPLLRWWGLARGLDVYQMSPFRLDGLAVGSWLAVGLSVRPAVAFLRGAWISLALFCGIVVLASGVVHRDALTGQVLSFEVWQLLALALIGFSLAGQMPRGLRWLERASLRKTGEWSYGLFLIHPVLFYAVDSWHADVGGEFWLVVVRALGVYTISFILARMSYEYFERPAYRYFVGTARAESGRRDKGCG